MAFNTSRTVTWDPESGPEYIRFVNILVDIMYAEGEFDNDADITRDEIASMVSDWVCGDFISWSDSEHHLSLASKNWPYVLFTVDCVDDDDRQWRTFIRDGRLYSAFYTPPKFDEELYVRKAAVPQSTKALV